MFAHLPTGLLTCLLVCSLARSHIYLPTRSLICPLICSSSRSFAHLPARSLTCEINCSLTCSSAHLPADCSYTHLFAHLPACLLTCPLVCSFAHSLAHLPAHGARGGGGRGGGGDNGDPASIHVPKTILQPHVRKRKEKEKPSQSLGEEHETKIIIAPKLMELERFGFHQCVEETIFYLEGCVKPICSLAPRLHQTSS